MNIFYWLIFRCKCDIIVDYFQGVKEVKLLDREEVILYNFTAMPFPMDKYEDILPVISN